MPAPTDRLPLGLQPGGLALHIGVHKTGTTAIQAALANSRPVLDTWGVRYPGEGQAHRLIASSAMGRRLGWRVGGSAAPDPHAWTDFVKDAHAYRGITVCSSEFFAESSTETAQGIVDKIGKDRTHVIITLRNLGRILPSAWQQILKSGYETAYIPWLTHVLTATDLEPKAETFWIRHRHDEVVERWARIAGPERVTVVVVDDAERDGIYRNFENLLGLPDDTLLNHRDAAPNRSMTLAEAELLRQLNISLGGGKGWRPFSDQVHDGLIKAMIERRIPGSDETRMQTPQWALDRAAELARIYVDVIRASGVNVVGDLGVLSEHLQGPEVVEEVPPISMPISAAMTAMLGALDGSRPSAELSTSARLKRRVKKLQTELRAKGRP
ncbi:MAG: hypothetical protein Q7L55_07415 [Actinomycetota bacterium]|nr:hypothetical protein [Actinomycetota bacterium]